jgi:hypothetical protein
MLVLYRIGNTSATALDGRRLRSLDARQRACVAANVLDDPGPLKPNVTQLVGMLRTSVAYVAIARRLPESQRAAIIAGIDSTSFSQLKKQRRSNNRLLSVVRTAGVGRVLDAACVEAAE